MVFLLCGVGLAGERVKSVAGVCGCGTVMTLVGGECCGACSAAGGGQFA